MAVAGVPRVITCRAVGELDVACMSLATLGVLAAPNIVPRFAKLLAILTSAAGLDLTRAMQHERIRRSFVVFRRSLVRLLLLLLD